ncbi:hypothetical protein BC629DRAFT_1441827 [Irpex lacteus]|nr:hypothetical protein BC629DRAFT_1441827 [Irpex lacteus]
MIYDPSTDRVVTDSIPIMRYLDDTYPDTPPLFPKGIEALHVAFSKYGWVFLGYPVFHTVLKKITASLNPISEKFLRAEREAHFKRPLAELNTPEQWKLFEERVGKLKYFLAANGEGKDTSFSGSPDPKTISYSDVLIAAILIWPRTVFGPESEEWRRISGFHGGFVATFMKRFLDYEYVDVGEALVNHS